MPITDTEKMQLFEKDKADNINEFNKMRRVFPNRLNILAEGDSWFAYPPNWIFSNKPSNLIDHISTWTKRKANFYSMASNGDEAVDMISGKQKHNLVNILCQHKNNSNLKPIDILLFSGGGNDIVGENDFERFLRPYKNGNNAQQCVQINRLRRKSKQIGLAYEELADIRDHLSPGTVIITHTYDYAYPSNTGAVFLGGLIRSDAWMKRFMDRSNINIPKQLQADVIKLFMDTMADVTLNVSQNRNDFIVVDTRTTLKGKKYWLNEIHPTSNGFKLIAKEIYKKMKARFPGL